MDGKPKDCCTVLCLAFLLFINIVLLITLVVYADRANSEACLQGFKFRNESLLLQEKVKQINKSFLELEGQWQSCINVSKDLNKKLEEVTSEEKLLLEQLQELKEENQDLAEKLRNAETVLQEMEREECNTNERSSALPGPQIYSLLLGLSLAIILLP